MVVDVAAECGDEAVHRLMERLSLGRAVGQGFRDVGKRDEYSPVLLPAVASDR